MGRLRNTYIIFTSDNGFFFGEHRLIGGKFLAYEPATHLPFLIRGPGIKPGTSTGELSSQIDIAPTVLELAGVTADRSLDGRSMIPFLKDPSLRTRRPIIFSPSVQTSDVKRQADDLLDRRRRRWGSRATGAQTEAKGELLPARTPPRRLAAGAAEPYEIRLGPYKYIAWPDGEKGSAHQQGPEQAQQHRQSRTSTDHFLHRQLRRCEPSAGNANEPTPASAADPRQFERLRAEAPAKSSKHEQEREKERRERERNHPGKGK